MKSFPVRIIILTACLSCCIASIPSSRAAGIPVVTKRNLSDLDISPQGKAALAKQPKLWRHAETDHFIYHFTEEKKAETVYIHAEVYYKWIKKLFGIRKDAWKKKAHLFIFNEPQVWDQFKLRVSDLFQGDAFTNGWELFLYRNPNWAAPRISLAHEITHLILFRFLDGPIPLALNEGFAEFVSYRALAMQMRRSEYDIRKTIPRIPANQFIQLSKLIAMKSYPQGQIDIFYQESELLVRFLILKHSGEQFYSLIRDVSNGVSFDRALKKFYRLTLKQLSTQFYDYAVKK